MSSVRPLRACVSSEAWRLARGRGVRAGLRAAGAAGGRSLKGSLKGSRLPAVESSREGKHHTIHVHVGPTIVHCVPSPECAVTHVHTVTERE